MEFGLEGRGVLISGGSKGLGLAMAEQFVLHGAHVMLGARRQQALDEACATLNAHGRGRAHGFSCDVLQPARLEALHEAALGQLGQVDVLINNVGTSRTGAFEELSDAVWQEDLDLKLFSAIRLCRLVLPGMKARRWGRIINVLNTGAKAPPAQGAPTAVVRAAGMALTKVLSKEYAASNVLVNALCTGLFITEQWETRWQREAPQEEFAAYTARLGERVPLGRMGQAAEFARLACFLASEAGAYISGTAINADGGLCPVV